MARYFFHIDDGTTAGDTPRPEGEGCELATLDSAKAEALRRFGEVIRDHPALAHGEELRLQVTDATGLALFDLNLLVTEAPVLRVQ